MPSKSFPSRNKTPGYDITVTVDVGNGLEAYDKGNFPPDIQTEYNGQTITWLCNFGVRHSEGTNKGRDLMPEENMSYTVRLQLPDDPNNAERTICIYNPNKPKGERVIVMARGRSKADIVFTLKLGDPPTGVFP